MKGKSKHQGASLGLFQVVSPRCSLFSLLDFYEVVCLSGLWPGCFSLCSESIKLFTWTVPGSLSPVLSFFSAWLLRNGLSSWPLAWLFFSLQWINKIVHLLCQNKRKEIRRRVKVYTYVFTCVERTKNSIFWKPLDWLSQILWTRAVDLTSSKVPTLIISLNCSSTPVILRPYFATTICIVDHSDSSVPQQFRKDSFNSVYSGLSVPEDGYCCHVMHIKMLIVTKLNPYPSLQRNTLIHVL
jgi:hypothetical protein